ncbi:hypothetical protein JHK86_027645 [Glycine max]|nr:hypothetical protein JHK86_027645 [Glycine max]
MDGYQYTWARHRGKHDTIEEKLDRALAKISLLKKLLYVTKNGNQTAQGYIKCNIDAAIFQDIHAFGIGICIRGGQVTSFQKRATVTLHSYKYQVPSNP